MNGAIDLQSPVVVASLGSIGVESDGDGNERLPEMDADDLYEQGDTTYLTLAPRILNLQKVTDRLSELEDAMMTAVIDTCDGAEMSAEDMLERRKVDTKRILRGIDMLAVRYIDRRRTVGCGSRRQNTVGPCF